MAKKKWQQSGWVWVHTKCSNMEENPCKNALQTVCKYTGSRDWTNTLYSGKGGKNLRGKNTEINKEWGLLIANETSCLCCSFKSSYFSYYRCISVCLWICASCGTHMEVKGQVPKVTSTVSFGNQIRATQLIHQALTNGAIFLAVQKAFRHVPCLLSSNPSLVSSTGSLKSSPWGMWTPWVTLN